MEHTMRDTQYGTRLTVETALWILVALVALALRLANLDAAPLGRHEAREAMLAWRAVTGQGMPEGDYSPLLLAANALLFFLFGASDVLARLLPALTGSSLALAPFLLRQRIGRLGALVAGLYLAVSPTALFASRQLDGAVMAAAGGMALLGGLVRFSETRGRPWLTLTAGGLALALTSSPLACGLLLTLGLAWMVLAWAWPPEGGIERLLESLRPHAMHASLAFALVALALCTGLGWNLAGLEAAGDLPVAWLARFGPASDPVASPLTLAIVYEPLGLLFGLGGLVWAIRHGKRFCALMGLWAGLGVLLLAVMPGRAALDLLWVVLPLAALVGTAVEALVCDLRARGLWLSEGLLVLVVLLVWSHFLLLLLQYANPGAWQRDLYLRMALLAVGLQMLLAAVFSVVIGVGAALRAVAVGVGVLLLVGTLSAGWGVAYVRPTDPRELLVRESTSVGVRDLVHTLRDLSWREMGMPMTLPFTFEAAPDSVLAWYLRDFSAARRVDSLESLDAADVGSLLVTSRRDLAAIDVPRDVGFVGQDFALHHNWNPLEIGCTWEEQSPAGSQKRSLRCDAAVRWLLLRRAPSSPVADQLAVLWQRSEVAEPRSEIGE